MNDYLNWHPNFPTNLQNCQDEPIHRPGAIQKFGILIAYERETGKIRAASKNAALRLKKTSTTDLINQPIRSFIDFADAEQILEQSFIQRKFIQTQILADQAPEFWPAVLYSFKNLNILEIEVFAPSAHTDGNVVASIPNIIQHLKVYEKIEDICGFVSEKVKALTGFDRVMVYRYDESWNGEVIAEAKENHLESFFGLHYPASDIPVQARKLYEKNWIRLIPTIYYEPIPIEPAPYLQMDLSNSVLRSVSPIHILYLKNMGVRASMSVSLIIDGKLWGLIACHHYSDHYVPLESRLGLESLAQVVSWHIQAKQLSQALKRSEEDEIALNKSLRSFIDQKDFRTAASEAKDQLLEMFNCTGVAIHLGEDSVYLGDVPPAATLTALSRLLADRNIFEPFVTDDLKSILTDHAVLFDPAACGFMALSLAPRQNYNLICFRPEQTQYVNWAGNPSLTLKNTIDETNPTERLRPRGSFTLWRQENKGRTLPWDKRTIDMLERFALLFIKVVIERKEIVEKAITELRTISQAKDEFVAIVSHELRTPLNSIIGWTELLLSGQLGADKLTEALRVIQRNARSQNQLIGDLLDVSRIISGKMKLSVKNMRVSEVVEAVVLSFEPAANAKGIRIAKALEGWTDSIIGDPGRVQQVIWNVLSNAIKFSPKNSSILVTVKRSDSQIQIEVSDHGPGIEQHNLEKIFQRFEQLDSSITRAAGGLGLGLAISKHIVELHGGTIVALSPGLGKGTTFKVSFPIAPVAPEMLELPIDDQLLTGELNQSFSNRLTGEVILIVEDEADALAFLKTLITSHGAEIYTARNGKEALEIVEAHNETIGIILSDVGMPEMDGYTLVKTIRESQNPKISSICTIALTAFGHPRDRITALNVGFDSYIAKPVMQEELLAVLESTCKSKKRGHARDKPKQN